jgi:hypothetical protein
MSRKRWLTADAVAGEIFGGCVTARTVRRMAQRPADPLPCIRVAGQGDERSDRVWFDPDAVAEWLGRQSRGGDAAAAAQ